MAVELRRKLRGPTSTLDTMFGSEGLLAMDRNRNELRLFDGVKLGGFRILSMDNADGIYVRRTTKIEGEIGITGGGDLSTDRKLRLAGQARALHEFNQVGVMFRAGDSDFRRAVPGYGIQIGLDPTPGATNLLIAADTSEVVSTVRTITATSPLTGGGDLSANRAIGVNSNLVPVSRSISAGDGLSGGGPMANSAGGALALAIDKTKVPYARNFVFGNGLTGTSAALAGNGGNISTQVDRAWVLAGISMGTGLVQTGIPANPDATTQYALDPSYRVPTSRTITAGNGLTGGGDMSGNRSFALGTPAELSNTTTNAVTSTSHTHSIAQNTARIQMAAEADDGKYNNVGMPFFAATLPGYIASYGAKFAGDLLVAAGASSKNATPFPAAWRFRCLGRALGGEATLWIRVE